MRHTCEHCSTNYDIPDDKIATKRLRVRCSRCRGIMWVVGRSSKEQPPPLPPPKGPFYYSANGRVVGPLSGPAIAEMARCGELTARSYVYAAGWKRWRRVIETPALSWLYDAVVTAQLYATKSRTDVFSQAALLSDEHGYFPDPTLKSGLIVLDQASQKRLLKLAQKNGIIEPRRGFSFLKGFAAAAAASLFVGAGLGVAAHLYGLAHAVPSLTSLLNQALQVASL